MNTFVKFIFYTGFLFFGGGFLVALFHFVLYNGMGDLFEYVPSDKTFIEKKTDVMPNKLVYKYFIENREYTGSQNVSSELILKIDLDSTTILYNKIINRFSMVQGITGRSSKPWDQLVGMVIMGFFFLFLFLLYKFADIDKWVGVYTRGEYKSSRKK